MTTKIKDSRVLAPPRSRHGWVRIFPERAVWNVISTGYRMRLAALQLALVCSYLFASAIVAEDEFTREILQAIPKRRSHTA